MLNLVYHHKHLSSYRYTRKYFHFYIHRRCPDRFRSAYSAGDHFRSRYFLQFCRIFFRSGFKQTRSLDPSKYIKKTTSYLGVVFSMFNFSLSDVSETRTYRGFQIKAIASCAIKNAKCGRSGTRTSDLVIISDAL